MYNYAFLQMFKAGVKELLPNQNEFNFVIIDMGNRKMFDFISNTYLIGNHDTPGIMATFGDNLYYKNWEKFTNYQSF